MPGLFIINFIPGLEYGGTYSGAPNPVNSKEQALWEANRVTVFDIVRHNDHTGSTIPRHASQDVEESGTAHQGAQQLHFMQVTCSRSFTICTLGTMTANTRKNI